MTINMKQFFLLIAVAMLAVALPAQEMAEKKADTRKADMQENAEKAEPAGENVDGPVLTLDNDVVDYGEIEQGSEPLRKVSFTNTGNAPLVISNAKGSCGCTVPTWPREPIAPGESADIEIRYDTKRTGSINKRVTLTTNDATGNYVIRVVGHISQKVEEEGLPEKKGLFENENN